ncbi:MAG: GNAT family N-acetyltransferase [Paracoccaceae bacterium]
MLQQKIVPALHVEQIRSLAELQALSVPLADLSIRAGAMVFQHPAFFLPWARVAMAIGQEPICLALYRGDTLTGFLPLFQLRDRRAMMARILATPRYGSSPPFDLILADPDPDVAMGILADKVMGLPWLEQQVRLDTEGSKLGGAWADRFAASGCAVTRSPGQDYLLHRCQGGEQDFYNALPRKHRTNCERLERRLLSEGRVELTTKTGAGLDQALKALAEVVRSSWKGSVEMERHGLALLTELARSLAGAGMLRLWLAYLDQTPIAYLLEIEDWRHDRHAFHNAQREGHGPYSPGVVLLFTALRAAYAESVETYDYWGNRDYLKKFANDVRPTRSVTIGRPGALPALQRRVRLLLQKGNAP